MAFLKNSVAALSILAALSSCSEGDNENLIPYGVARQSISIDDAESAAPPSSDDVSVCSLQPETVLLELDLRIDDRSESVVLSLENISDGQLRGDVELATFTALGTQTVRLPFQVAAGDVLELLTPMKSLASEMADLAVITASTKAFLEDGSMTFTSARVVHDSRAEKPEEKEPAVADEHMEGVSPAFVIEGVDEERLRLNDAEIIDHGAGSRAASPDSFQTTAQVANKTLCFDAGLNLDGAGIGEDAWSSPNSIVWARRQRIDAKAPGSSSWSTWWLSASGCITADLATGSWEFRTYSQTRLNKNGIWTVIDTRREDTNALTYGVTLATLNSSTSQTLTYSASDTLVTSHLVHHALYEYFDHLTVRSFPLTIPVKVFATATGASAVDVAFTDADRNDKWKVAHEVGHYVFFNETDRLQGSDYGYDSALTGVTCADATLSHTAISREWNSVANIEGFASYWSALVFNTETQSDCWTRFSSRNISCAGGDAQTPLRYMETQCLPGSFAGQGNETDWQRAYWALTQGVPGSPVPTVSELLALLRSATGWTRSNHWSRIDVATQLSTTPWYLHSRWDAYGPVHGIDH